MEQELDTLGQVGALRKEYPGWMFKTQASRSTRLAQMGRGTAR
jgi:hypothetical protein